jgi:putative glycosyltransferase (TIGR04372 family)
MTLATQYLMKVTNGGGSCLLHLVNKIFGFFNRKSPVLIVTPWCRNIGNCAEEMYYGLLKARREGKEVVFLFPHELFWKFRFGVTNRELFIIKSDYCLLSSNNIWRYLAGWLLTLGFGTLRASYLLHRKGLRGLRRLWPRIPLRPYNGGYTLPTIGVSTLWQPHGINRFSWEIVRALDWKGQYNEYLPVRLSDEKRRHAQRVRAEMGIPQLDWFVCLHVREGGFKKDAELGAYRNASIQNYIKGIQVITDAGGWVVRMGDSSMTPLPPMERVIDYPHTPFKSDLMDIYLISECRFYIGVNSGPADIVRLFQKHMVLTNLTEWLVMFPVQKGDLAIIRHVFSRSRNRLLSVKEIVTETKEILSETTEIVGGVLRDPGEEYVFFENTEEEIRDVIEEYLKKPGDYNYSELQCAFNHERSVEIHRWLDQDFLWQYDPLEDAIDKYRIASRADSVLGTLGQRYLEQNWIEDSMNLKNVRVG